MSNATLVHETANAPGTNVTFNLAGHVAGRRSFAQVFPSGSPVFYVMLDGVQSEWGLGPFTAGAPNQISRTTVFGNSSNTTARLNFTGVVDVYCSVPAEVGLYLGADWGGDAAGTPNALSCTVPIPLRSQIPGTRISLRASADNTGPVTLNVNGLGDHPYRLADGAELPPGAITDGALIEAVAYSATEWRVPGLMPASGTNWERLPSGLIIQRGTAITGAGGNVSVTFPIAFPAGNVHLALTTSATTGINHTYQGLDQHGFFLQSWLAGAVAGTAGCSYIAIGR